jgi:general stress protein 26
VELNEIDQKEAREKVTKLLAGAKTVYLGTNGSHGHPNVRAMTPAYLVGAETIWFVTDVESSKVMELLKDDKAVLYAPAARNNGECRLWGRVEIFDDLASKKLVWQASFKEHFPEGIDSPRLRVLCFHVNNALYCNKAGKTGEFKN